MSVPFLSFLIWFPIIGGVATLFFSGKDKDNQARCFALFISLVCFLVSVVMLYTFDASNPDMQFIENVPWIESIRVNYFLGVDGISFPLIILSCFTTVVVVLISWSMVETKVPQYLAAFLLTQGMIVGVFSSLNAILFYIFWEGLLIPMYLSIGIWGGSRRSYAAIKFFLFTFFGSALMLIAFLYLRMEIHSFSIIDFQDMPLTLLQQKWIFWAFLLAFAIKVPLWPLHTWLPDAHTEAPTGGSVVLAALMLKLGAYGFLRFTLPIVPDASHYYEWLMIVLSLIAIVYVGLIALAQTDMKKLIAYSSIAHMGFVTLGCFMATYIVSRTDNLKDAYMALEGALTQMISHAFGSGAMFIAFGIIYQQLKTRNIADFGGIAKPMPYFAAFFMVFVMSNVGLPGTSGFVGEFMIMLSTFEASFWVTIIAASTLIIGAVYSLWMYKRVFYGQIVHDRIHQLKDVAGLDKFTLAILAITVIWIGVYPNAMMNLFHASVGKLLLQTITTKL